MKKKWLHLLVAASIAAGLLSGCAGGTASTPTPSPTPVEKTKVSIAMLAGPTGMGAVELMQKNDDGTAANEYDFTVATAPEQITGKIISGELDIAAVPTNLAAVLYNKTGGKVQIAAVNTLGVLYILENGDTVHSMEDLRGKTIYATGQGSNPEYVLNYLLRKNGLEPGVDVTIEYKASEELAALMASGGAEIAMLPVPAATGVLLKNSSVRAALNLSDEWEKAVGEDGGVLTQGCIVVQKTFAEEHPEALEAFLSEYSDSISYVTGNSDEAAKLIYQYGITGSEAIAAAAIPDSNLVFLTGDDMKTSLDAYFQVLFDADPASVGGTLPDDGIYYTK
ncbi:ABC transporter substrate-binding protein [Papillibacter cinnamivorans]|uniref:NitT/TauT family transport system substrate-binding protein n=1 Tax=Papillibacter cinnamivorans DSM 12816 TaxID=1122930 RepID=A0A1W2A4V1_9FIRM|nr:PhnD/SsuA/transferrin family substrate-binding protein [Papillibacter cinnamivorans]SMC55308.1 NitT/TauT family transport system substrate-binding protein [Papillibacter cinnamivorans DSM 12816]